MRPLKLTMQAFGSYGKGTPPIDFTKPSQNLFLITGDTGAGKTTIFDAIVFSLYGEASSGSNRKDGTELQSQFVDYGTEPFVELTFSEKSGEETRVYTVRRTPRHVRPLKRGSGVREESESVCLRMPDGSVYPQKETDRKLEEIVGLTKDQFMQVAMIAQGEFMEMLRARSDDKKVIFRKLFKTELFQKIVDELGKQRKEKLSDMAQIRTVCQTETGHIVVPKDYERSEMLEVLKARILSAERLSVTDMEALLSELKLLCDELEEGKEAAQKAYEDAGRQRDASRDAFTGAQSLLRSFEQFEKAEKELAECSAQEEEIRKTSKLIMDIHEAYHIRTVYERLADVREALSGTERNLKEQQEAFPELVRAYREAADGEAEAKERQEAELETFARISQRVKTALDLLDRIDRAKAEREEKEGSLAKAEEAQRQAHRQLQELEEQEKEWRRQSGELAGADRLFALFQVKEKEAEELFRELGFVKKICLGVEEQKKRADKAQKEYGRARQNFADRNGEYVEKQTAFLDAQAGFIAREKLRQGQPCPVCGSLEHPHPCRLSEDYQHLTREALDDLAEEVAGLSREQENKASAASAARELLEEKKERLKEAKEKFRERMARSIPDMPESLTIERGEELLISWKGQMEKEGAVLQERAELLSQVQKSLEGVDERRHRLKEAVKDTDQKALEAKTALAGSQAVLAGLETDRDYPTREDADAALQAAAALKNEKDKLYEEANQRAKTARQRKDNAQTLILRYTKELPGQQKQCAEREAAYEMVMVEKNLTEKQWKEITENHQRAETSILQDRVDAHNRKKAAAQGISETAGKAVAGRQRPVMEELESAKRLAEENWNLAQRNLERYSECCRADLGAYQALAPKMEERTRIMQDYTRLDSLYNRLAGKVTGSRMDIETFVQRYYLQKILYAANERFREMSAGQFELRMVSEEQAGEGKNRGLDLMVYSAVTGREREVRTLSGGESFMAALSLALGMADQIQESAAAIHLDVMFIDEGFGSLDDHSRQQAVRVLQQMTGDSKLIGIISHVLELKQEIEDQLLVTRDEEGSHVKWQIS